MNETNETTVETSEEWRELPTVLCQPPEFSGLEKRDSFYQSGDYWVSFVETAEVEHRAHVDSDAAKLHAVRGVSDCLLGGWDAWYGRLQPCGDAARTFTVYELPPKLQQVLCAMSGASANGLSFGDYFVPEDVDSLCNKLETNTGYKVHKQARALYLKHLQGDAMRNTRGDYNNYHEAGAVCMLAKLHGLVVNRFAVPIGLGFEDGNPLVILAEPVCRDGHRVESFCTKSMRLGKWLQSVWGNAKDIRPLVEDIKVLNRPRTTYLCTTEQEWYDAYEGGQSSCMTGNSFEYSPVRCYASTSHGLPDNGLRLFIQYVGELFGDNFEVQVRAIVNINEKTYVRAYGTAADAVLRAAGYERDGDCLDGCILARIPYPGDSVRVLMPYLDGDNDYVDGHVAAGIDCFVVTGDGEHQALEADGYIYLEEGEECVCCGSNISYHDASYGTYDGIVGNCCIDEYHLPVGRVQRYHEFLLNWSEWHDDWVHIDDTVECDIQGPVHDSCGMTEAQGRLVMDQYVEPDSNGDYILTLEACEILGEDYLGGIDEDEDKDEEAA